MDDRGAATVWSLALLSLLLLVGLVCSAVASLAVTRQRAATVADVAALAAAGALDDPCTQADRSALANGMRLGSCRIHGADVLVEVTARPSALVVRLYGLLGREPADVTAVARAGPPSP